MKVSVLGTGVIGKSWVALFLAHKLKVSVYDCKPNYETDLIQFIESTSDSFDALDLPLPDLNLLKICGTAAQAISGASFIQENLPEKLEIKHATYREIEKYLLDNAIVLSSTSGFSLKDLQKGFDDPSRIIIAHPFNPPHLIPLVEVFGDTTTKDDAVNQVLNFYESLGKTPIALKKSVPGHIANRLQAVLWQETLALARDGVASLEDIDKAVAAGPGLRWAVFGPNQLFALAAGDRGLNGFIEHLGSRFESWWATAGQVVLDNDMLDLIASSELANQSPLKQSHLIKKRDDFLISMISKARKAEQ